MQSLDTLNNIITPLPKLEELKNHFLSEGYVVVPNVIDPRFITEAQKEIKALVKKGVEGKLKSTLTWFEYPSLKNKMNIAEIVHPFEEEGHNLPNVIAAMDSIDYAHYFNSILGFNLSEYEATVMRFHVTTGDYKYAQPWHRDSERQYLSYNEALPPEEVKINLYFFDEIGFKVIPKSDPFFNQDCSHDEIIWREKNQKWHTFFKIDGEVTVKANQGDLLFFHPDIFHRGYSSQFRASMHILFERKDRTGPRYPEFRKFNNLSYTPRTTVPLKFIKQANFFRKLKNLIWYFSPIPSKQYFLNIFNESRRYKKLKNVFYARSSFYQE